jgi:hypothetical protein
MTQDDARWRKIRCVDWCRSYCCRSTADALCVDPLCDKSAIVAFPWSLLFIDVCWFFPLSFAGVLASPYRRFPSYVAEPDFTTQVSEIGLYYKCWWYSLCNFQYRSNYENTCSYTFDCWIYTNMYCFIFILCVNTITSMITTNLFSIWLISRAFTHRPWETTCMGLTNKVWKTEHSENEVMAAHELIEGIRRTTTPGTRRRPKRRSQRTHHNHNHTLTRRTVLGRNLGRHGRRPVEEFEVRTCWIQCGKEAVGMMLWCFPCFIFFFFFNTFVLSKSI